MAASHDTGPPLSTSSAGKGFLDLPPELRNQVYGLILSKHHGTAPPGIINTCKQTRADAIKLFYSTHCFDIYEDAKDRPHRCAFFNPTYDFIKAIGQDSASRIRAMRFHVEVIKPAFRAFCGWSSPRDYVQLQLEVRLREDSDGSWSAVAEWTVPGGTQEGFVDVGFLPLSAKDANGMVEQGVDPAAEMWLDVAQEVRRQWLPSRYDHYLA